MKTPDRFLQFMAIYALLLAAIYAWLLAACINTCDVQHDFDTVLHDINRGFSETAERIENAKDSIIAKAKEPKIVRQYDVANMKHRSFEFSLSQKSESKEVVSTLPVSGIGRLELSMKMDSLSGAPGGKFVLEQSLSDTIWFVRKEYYYNGIHTDIFDQINDWNGNARIVTKPQRATSEIKVRITCNYTPYK